MNVLRQLHDLVQHTVNAVANPDAFGLGLDVDVAGALLNRALDEDLGDSNDRSFVGDVRDTVGVNAVRILVVLHVRGEHSALAHRLGEGFDVAHSEIGGATSARRLFRGCAAATAHGTEDFVNRLLNG